jgi:hypothetical protein
VEPLGVVLADAAGSGDGDAQHLFHFSSDTKRADSPSVGSPEAERPHRIDLFDWPLLLPRRQLGFFGALLQALFAPVTAAPQFLFPHSAFTRTHRHIPC